MTPLPALESRKRILFSKRTRNLDQRVHRCTSRSGRLHAGGLTRLLPVLGWPWSIAESLMRLTR